MKKGQTMLAAGVAVVITAVFATVIWGIINPMTVVPDAVYNETINFAANNTDYDFGQSSENIYSVIEIWNGTTSASWTLPSDRYVFDDTNDQIRILTNSTVDGGVNITTGNKYVSYRWRYNTYLTRSMERNMMGYVFTFFILGMLVLAGAYIWMRR